MSLNEEITAKEYHKKREKLIQEKTSLKEKVRNCEREQVDWLEPKINAIFGSVRATQSVARTTTTGRTQ